MICLADRSARDLTGVSAHLLARTAASKGFGFETDNTACIVRVCLARCLRCTTAEDDSIVRHSCPPAVRCRHKWHWTGSQLKSAPHAPRVPRFSFPPLRLALTNSPLRRDKHERADWFTPSELHAIQDLPQRAVVSRFGGALGPQAESRDPTSSLTSGRRMTRR